MSFKADLSRLERAVREKIQVTGRDLGEQVNQTSLNVAGRSFDLLPPASVEAKRKEVQVYLATPMAIRIKRFSSGKRKGQFGKKGTKNRQLQRVHLILQARRRKAGLKGLQGTEMANAAGRFKQRAAASVGFVKSLWLPVIVGLNPLCKFKFPFRKTSSIARWRNSAGYGRVLPARGGMRATALMNIGARMANAAGSERVRVLHENALSQAMKAEAREMVRHLTERLRKAA